jgi:hypothetical protein
MPMETPMTLISPVPPLPATHSGHRRWRLTLPFACALMLTGCGGAKLDNLAMSPAAARARPNALRIEVALAPDVQTTPAAMKAAQMLRIDLAQRYRGAGLVVLPPDPNAALGHGATLHLLISRADPGQLLARLVVGFGAGQSRLGVATRFTLDGQESAALTFSSDAKSGRKPGLIMPGAIAAATGDAAHLAIGGGLDLLLAGRSGLKREADQSAKRIVEETRALYRASGWMWPADPNTLMPNRL